MPTIKKAIMPVAGFGTRFLPVTKAQPKEMIPIVDKPVIQFLVEEAVNSGIEEIILVTGASKRAIEDHFDRNFELEYRLKQGGKDDSLKLVKDISDLARFVYVRQKEQLGDGHAVLQAKQLIQNEPVAIIFGDDIIDQPTPYLKEMIEIYEKYKDPVIALGEVPKSEVSNYGVIKGKEIEDNLFQIMKFVEKPKPKDAPSNLVFVGRVIMTPELLKVLENSEAGLKDGEIRMADAFRKLIETRVMYGHKFSGTWYNCGNKLEYLKAVVNYGLRHPEVKDGFKKYLKDIK
ncbi:MAG: UTP--glucose-1-phosphate uridylyltransferase GalU [bacterium]